MRAFPLILLALTRCACDEPAATPDTGSTTSDGSVVSMDGSLTDASSMDASATLSSIEIAPADATIVTDGITPARQTYAVAAKYSDGTQVDVTSSAIFTRLPELGSMSGPTFESSAPGTLTISATYGGKTVSASLKIVLQRVVSIPPVSGAPLPANPGSVFGSAPSDPSRAPTVVYPTDGTLIPRNLGAVEIHFLPGPNNTLFEVSLEHPLVSIRIHTRCVQLAEGCWMSLDGSVFASVAQGLAGREALEIRVRGTDDASTGTGASAASKLSFSARPVQGGLYYWTTSNGAAIMRVDFGDLARPPERFFPAQGDGRCFGCHSLSPNGQRMTLSHAGQWQGQLTLLEVATGAIALTNDDDHREQFQTWAPGSDRFAGIFGDGDPVDTNIRIRDGLTGMVQESIPIGQEVSHPDWSPRGDRIAFTWVTHHQTSQRPGRGGIAYVGLENGAWSTPHMLVEPVDGKNRFTPAHDPSGRFLVFAESTCPAGQTYDGSCDADADPSTRFFAIQTNGSGLVELSKINAQGPLDTSGDLSNTFPKWAPFVDERFQDGTGSVMWMTFSSRRAYGLRRETDGRQWLWMAAVDPDKVLASADGSFPAFALPFQDFSTSNHMAQWAAKFVPTQPGNDGGPDPGRDDAGTRNDGGPDPGHDDDAGTCLAIGDPCQAANDRCCTGGVCAQNGPGIFICRPDF